MKSTLLLLISLTFSTSSRAAEFAFTNRIPKLLSQERVIKELTKEGFAIVSATCTGDNVCQVIVTDKSMRDRSKANGAFSKVTGRWKVLAETAQTLSRKLKAGTATPMEKDQLLGILTDAMIADE